MPGGFIGRALIDRLFFSKLMILSSYFLANLYTMVIFAFLIQVGAGFTYTNYFAYCLERFPKNAGMSGGLTGGMVYMILSLLTYLVVAAIPAKDMVHLSFSYLVFIACSLMVRLILLRINRQPAITERLTD